MEYEDKWREAYLAQNVSVGDYNPHKKFSELTGLSYEEAKELAYKNMFQKSTPFIVKQLLDSNKKDLESCYELVKRFSDNDLTKSEFYKLL